MLAAKTAFSSLLVLSLSACVIPPDLGELPQPRSDLVSNENKGSNSAVYPQQDWWKIYKDPQLDVLIQEGLARSPNIAEASARLLKAEALLEQADASLFPSVGADASVQKYRQSYNVGVPAAFVPKGFHDLGIATLNINYDVDFWGKNREIFATVLSEREAARLETDQAKMILSTSVAAMYAKLSQFYAELDEAKESVAVRLKTVQLFEKRYKNGLENEGGVDQAKANHASAEADVAAIDESIGLIRNGIVALMGATPSRAMTIERPRLSNIDPFGLPVMVPADLISRRPDLIASRLKLEAAAHRINVARSDFYPNINLAASLGHQSLGLDSFFKEGSLIGSIGPAIHLPIFDGKRIEGQYRGARADYEVSIAQYESVIIQAMREVADALVSKKALERRAQKSKAALAAAERAYKAIKNRYEGGLSTYLEVLRAEDTLISNRRIMADIRTRSFTLDVALVKSLGGGFQPTAEGIKSTS